jgi:hypothetical protein
MHIMLQTYMKMLIWHIYALKTKRAALYLDFRKNAAAQDRQNKFACACVHSKTVSRFWIRVSKYYCMNFAAAAWKCGLIKLANYGYIIFCLRQVCFQWRRLYCLQHIVCTS